MEHIFSTYITLRCIASKCVLIKFTQNSGRIVALMDARSPHHRTAEKRRGNIQLAVYQIQTCDCSRTLPLTVQICCLIFKRKLMDESLLRYSLTMAVPQSTSHCGNYLMKKGVFFQLANKVLFSWSILFIAMPTKSPFVFDSEPDQRCAETRNPVV
jgi:hypothetical protein